MSDHEALLAAIDAAPHDETPRLVYADWLDDHGHPDYASCIRLSCRLARQDVMHPAERSRLRRERHEAQKAALRAIAGGGGVSVGQDSTVPPGMMGRLVRATGEAFARYSSGWWPLVRPTGLILSEMGGYERRVGASPATEEIIVLACYGNSVSAPGPGPGWAVFHLAPLSAELLETLADGRATPRLDTFTAQPIRASAADLTAFTASPLAARLETVGLVVEFADASRQQLWASTAADWPVRQAVDHFITEYRSLLSE